MTCAIQAVTGSAHDKIASQQIKTTVNKVVCEEGSRGSRQMTEKHLWGLQLKLFHLNGQPG